MEDSRPVLGIETLKAELRAKLEGRQEVSVEDRRRAVDAIADFGAPGCAFETEVQEIAGVPTTRFGVGEDTDNGAIIHLHGGAFVAGSARSHRYLAGSLAERSGVPVYVPAYRLAPENPFPAALDDVIAVAAELETRHGSRLALVGDSAGAALLLTAVRRLKEQRGAVFAALATISPFVDMRCENDTFGTLASVDPFIDQSGLKRDVAAYLGDADRTDPDVSPVFADLSGLPPLLIQVGSDEVLLGDAQALMAAAERAGVKARLDLWAGMVHVWHLFPLYVSEADAAIGELAGFLTEQLKI